MNVTKHGKNFSGEFYQLRCPECECEFTAEQDDFKIEISEKTLKKQYYLYCPECEKKIYRPDCELSSEINQVKSERQIRGEEIINEILNYIEFDKIHEVMDHTNWTWQGRGVPSVEKILLETKKALWDCWNEKRDYFSGGIYIRYLPEEDCGEDGWSNEGLIFYFVLETAGAFHTEEGELEYIP